MLLGTVDITRPFLIGVPGDHGTAEQLKYPGEDLKVSILYTIFPSLKRRARHPPLQSKLHGQGACHVDNRIGGQWSR